MGRLILRLLLLATCMALSAFAQQGRGAVLGTVTDTSGAAVPGAAVIITDIDTNAVFSTRSNGEGFYIAPTLAVGHYTVTAEHSGFKRAVHSGVILQVDQRAQVDFTLELGGVAESVEVTGSASLVDASTATIGTVIENRRIADLPLNGRNVFALVMLAPGVKSNAGPTNSGFADRGTDLSSISINGGPGVLNGWILDGVANSQGYYGDINVNPTVDAVQEFKVQANTMSSEYGFTAGGVINIVTKSGTNMVHGTLYDFVRNDAFDARNTFASSKPPYRYNQYGGALGGPLTLPKIYNGRDRSFFFLNYEEWRYHTAANPIISVPTAAQRGGDLSDLRDATGRLIPIYDPNTTRANPNGSGFLRDIFPGNLIPANRLDRVALNILPFYPLPNRPPTNPFTNSNNYISSNSLIDTMWQYTAKWDQRVSAKNTLMGRYMYYRFYTDGGTGNANLPDPVVRQSFMTLVDRNIALSDTHTFSPTFLNEFRLGVVRSDLPFRAAHYGGNWPAKLGLPPSVPPNVFPQVSNGLPNFRTGTSGFRGTMTWQFVDMLTKVQGNHVMKFGVDYRLQEVNNYSETMPSGSYTFPASLTGNPQSQAGSGSAFATFLLGAVGSASADTEVGVSQVGYSATGFFQDDWKVSRRLTLNLGLRYDFQSPPIERHNGLSNFNPYAIDPLSGLRGRMEYAGVDFGRSVLQPDKKAWGPRVGFAYDLFGNNSTVLRGGYGIFYSTIFYIEYFGSTAGFASTITNFLPPGGNTNLPAFRFQDGFPGPLTQPQGAKLGPSAFLGGNVTYDEANDRVPMSQQWNLSLQRQLPKSLLLEATYTGNHVTHFESWGYDLNQLDPQYWSQGLALQQSVPNPYAGKVSGALGAATITRSQSLRAYPYYNAVTVRNPHLGNSIYHALLLRMEKGFSSGISLLTSYTAGKMIDDAVVTPIRFGGVEQVSLLSYQEGTTNRRLERGLDTTDVSQRLVLSGLYELPFGKGKKWNTSNRWIQGAIGGWQVNTITTMQTGLPLIVRGANNFRADRPNSTGQSAQLSNGTVQRWFDTTAFVNPPSFTDGNVGKVLPDVRAPGIVNVDLSLIKDTAIHERARLQFRVEAFNVANHVNLLFPDVTFVPGANGFNQSATFGTITAARGARIVQLGLKLIY